MGAIYTKNTTKENPACDLVVHLKYDYDLKVHLKRDLIVFNDCSLSGFGIGAMFHWIIGSLISLITLIRAN